MKSRTHSLETAAEHPPGPANGPFGIRHIYRCNTRPLQFYERLGSYGDIATFRMFGVRAYFLNSPDLIHSVLRDTGTRFRKLPRNLKMLSRGLGQGLLSSEGPSWFNGRRLVQSAFNPRATAATVSAAAECVNSMLERWSNQHRVELFAELDRLTISVASRALLGITLENEASEIGHAARTLAESWATSLRHVIPLPGWVPLPRQCRDRRLVDFLRNKMRESSSTHQAGDVTAPYLMSLLVDSFNSAGADTRQNRERLIDHGLTLFIAAYHASTVTLCWTLYLLARNPAVQDRVLEEIDTELGEQLPTMTDIRKLSFTECVLKESMRMYPSAWEMFPRQAMEATSLGRWHIPRHAWLFMSPYVTHRDGRFYSNPRQFDPDRWAPERIGAIDPRAYFPFGGGRHICLGREMALAQNKLMLVMILRKFQLEFVDREHVPHPLPPMALVPRDPMWVTLQPRHALVPTHV